MDQLYLVYTNTTRFIFPMLFKNTPFNDIIKNDFINSYNFDYYEPSFNNKIIVVKQTNIKPISDMTCITSYKRKNDYIFIYDIPNEFKNDYECILQNKYEKISNNYIKILREFWGDGFTFPMTLKYNPIKEMYRVLA